MAEGRILYVEDNFENRILIKRVLEAEGYTVIEAEDGQSGIKLAQSESPDLVLMDINLPDVDGYECTARLRQLDEIADIPIVALTANVLEGDRQKAIAAGCDGYIPKPIDVDELPHQVAAYLKNRRKKPAALSPPGALAKPKQSKRLPPVSKSPASKHPVSQSPDPGPPNGREHLPAEQRPEPTTPAVRPERAADINNN